MVAPIAHPSERRSLSRGFFTVGIWTLTSRVLGFVRDVVFAALLGSGPVAEAFLIAFSLPNMFRRIFAEGAFNAAFVPLYSKKLASGGAHGFANDAFSGLAAILILLTVIAQLAMPVLVVAMASGFLGDGRFDLTVLLGRIVFPYILFISLAALLSGMLNAANRFAASAAAPVLLNAFFIVALFAADAFGLDAGLTLAWTSLAAGLAQLLLVWMALHRAGYSLNLRWPRLSPEMRRLAIVATPAALAGGVVQINLLIGRQVASMFEGAVAWLSYADRLYQLPLGVVGIAIGVVLLPELSRRLASEDGTGAREALSRSAEAALALSVPAAGALAVIPLPMIQVLFERGEFNQTDSVATAAALTLYAAGLPAFVLQKVVQTQFFARHDTRTPFVCALIAMLINAVIAVGLAKSLGYLSAALGATCAGWALLILLLLRTNRLGRTAQFDRRCLTTVPKIIAATIVMCLALHLAMSWSYPIVADSAWRYGWLAAIVMAGAVIYGTVLYLTGALRRSDIHRLIKR